MTIERKAAIALIALAGLAVAAWRLLDPGKWQQFTWIVLGFLAFRVVMETVRARYDEKHPPPDRE